MKIFTTFIAAALLFISSVALAQGKIGVIDMRAALFSSEAAKQFTDKMVSQYKQQDLEVRAVGEEGQRMEMRLKNDAAIMSDSERAKLASDLEEKIQEYKYLKTRLDKALAEKRNEFLTDSRPRLDTVINEIVKEAGLSVLLPREAALYIDESLDYTEKAIEKLNKLK